MNKFFTLILLAAVALCASARQLSPQEALSAAMASETRGSMRVAPRALQLVYTQQQPASQLAGVYVFGRPEGEGFVIAAADDCVAPLLGYSSDSRFDPNNIPESMQWLLDYYARQIAYASAKATSLLAPVKSAPALKNATYGDLRGPGRIARAVRSNISPICATTWNQGAPYNNLCPLMNGRRAVTGCVATATAQIMKVHEYPTTGVGSHSYEFTYGGSTFTDSFNFGTTTFNWSNMRNSYSGSYTTAQATAVATLMHACGVACDMSYTPDESGAYELYAAAGLIEYFNYDKGTAYYGREWFTAEDWDALIYSELAAGRPVLYTGVDSSDAGHAFVCDGYASSTGYFHINWGWGGTSDGYFTLSALDPYTQGIGGGSGDSGFNYMQSIIAGIRPPVAGSYIRPAMAHDGSLSTTSTSISRSSYNSVTFNTHTYSYTPATVDITIGLKLVPVNGGTNQYVTITSGSLAPFYGFSELSVGATKIPEGNWDVSMVCKTSESAWTDMYYDVENETNALRFDVTSSRITVSAVPEPSPVEAELSASLTGCANVSNADDEGFYAGHSYSFSFDVTSTAPWTGDVYCIIYDDNGYIQLMSDPIAMTFSAEGKLNRTWALEVPSDFTLGSYKLCLAYNDDGWAIIPPSYSIDIEAAPLELDIDVDLVSITGLDLEYDGEFYETMSYDLEWEISANQAWTDDVYCMLLYDGGDGYYIVDKGEAKPVSLPAAGTTTQTWTVTFADNLDLSRDYIIAIVDSDYSIWGGFYIDVYECPDPQASVTSVSMGDMVLSSTALNQLTYGDIYIDIALHSIVGPWNGGLDLVFTDGGGAKLLTTHASGPALGHNSDGTFSALVNTTSLADVQPLSIAVADPATGNALAIYNVVVRGETGIELIGTDAATDEWYDLSGRRATDRTRGILVGPSGKVLK